MSQLALRPSTEYYLVVLSGKARGTQFKIVGQRMSIGRSQENDIAISDDNKMSRNHALIQLGPNGLEIQNISDKNTLVVNGENTQKSYITNGTVLQIGDTRLQLKAVNTRPQDDSAAVMPRPKLASANAIHKEQSHRSRPRRNSGSKNFYILLTAVVLVFIYLFTGKPKQSEKVELRTEEDIETQIKDYNTIISEVDAEKRRLGQNTRQYEEAQTHFIKGFRDYQKGQYQRAIESFQACLSLFAAHRPCERYRNLAQKKFDELIQYHMILANKYKSQNQFDACKASYRNAMIMIGERDPKMYREAESGFKACDALEGDRY